MKKMPFETVGNNWNGLMHP